MKAKCKAIGINSHQIIFRKEEKTFFWIWTGLEQDLPAKDYKPDQLNVNLCQNKQTFLVLKHKMYHLIYLGIQH